MGSWPSLLLLVVFVACAGAIWLAGVKLSDTTDVLAERLHLGAALGGMVLLAIATNLPEIAITASAAVRPIRDRIRTNVEALIAELLPAG